MRVQQDAVDVYDQVDGDYDAFTKVMTDRGYSDMQCLNLHMFIREERGLIDPDVVLQPPTNVERANEIYLGAKGDKTKFVRRMMNEAGVSSVVASTYYQNAKIAKQAEDESLAMIGYKPRNKGLVEAAARNAEPRRRTIIVVMEVEVESFEDSYQTAELAVGILNGNMSNTFTLLAATDKV